MSDPQAYTIGWISALATEFVAAQQFLDERHNPPESVGHHDNNFYVLGRIGRHNVVMATLPEGEYGTTTAATVAKDMLRSFPNIRIGLMVGIGGGAPTEAHDIRLGDIVVSTRDGNHGGVFQYDFGKTIQDQTFHYEQHLNQPPQLLLTAVSGLKAQYMGDNHELDSKVRQVLERKPKLRKKFSQPPSSSDKLYRSDFVHQSSLQPCSEVCMDDPDNLVTRPERGEEDDNPAIHYGLIASANQLMKDALIRDKLATEKGVLCFEMEAAGLMNHFPCLVVRGICDYADSHKNKEWQGYAAMIASAYAKELLKQIPPNKVEAENRILETIGPALSEIEKTTIATQAAVVGMGSQLLCDKIKSWLCPPDPSTNINYAKKLRHEGTGAWLLKKPFFQLWHSGCNRHIWLYGLAGCGKTVLSATILDYLSERHDGLLLRFYFDFSDARKQRVSGMLRSLAFQMYERGPVFRRHLNALFHDHHDGQDQPPTKTLSEVIRKMLMEGKNVCVVLDALDESTTRDQLLRWIQDITFDPELHHVRLLCTSRPESDLHQGLPDCIGQENCFSVDRQALNEDIRAYVVWQLTGGEGFKKRKLSEDLVELIESKVGKGSDGMFRWAACQMDNLAKCPTAKKMREELENLPENLTKTYERMLQSIPKNLRNSATRLLQFLVHSEQPLTLQEAKEVIATNIDVNPPFFDADDRVFEESLVLQYAPGLISIVEVTIHRDTVKKELHLAHFSVKEFLEAQADFGRPSASNAITRTCLTYLKDITGSHTGINQNFPMARFAAKTWTRFGSLAEAFQDSFQAMLVFVEGEETFQRWCRLYQADWSWDKDPGPPKGSRLYYTCLSGLSNVARELINKGAGVNAQGGLYGNALQAASAEGHSEIVGLLLEKGADVNAQGGNYGNALQAASAGGYSKIVELLLETGADVNAQGRLYSNALQVASVRGRYEVVKLLLQKGADVNIQAGDYGNALQAASIKGYYKIAELLIEKGADVNAQAGLYGNALQAASSRGRYKVVKLLLEKGADVNAQAGDYSNALQVASVRGRYEVVKLLLEKGADINAQGGLYSNALQVASIKGYYKIVELLLEKEADVNAQGGPDKHDLQKRPQRDCKSISREVKRLRT
ncbi:unnamed protein product [Fusarium equiseti]|uniref:NACHT domain-containing protein n=1 Tax=Fusarium equiseti TaxID=61235 RepID=A0A8J2IH00_FUSEQ|nr:unnamed protein product [Fusarium equiseti]